MKEIRIGLLGCGTVGTGVAKMLLESGDLLSSRLGARLTLYRVADIDTQTDRGITLPPGVFTRDARAVASDPQVDIVIEMIGGQSLARDLILTAIDNGKPVVTANKALLALQGAALFEAADGRGVDLAFEASVGGCMPIIKTLRESLVGNHVGAMTGILNGTCNYILTRITDEGVDFADALSAAQARGYAEADSTLDVEGLDTAHKLSILTTLAYGTQVDFNDIYMEGISGITPLDVEFVRQFGYGIKLLAISKHQGDAVEARVHPTMIPLDNPLSSVGGTMNAVTVRGDAIGDIMLYGRGAGRMPTASAVIGDVVDLARNLLTRSPGRVPLRACQPGRIRKLPIRPMDAIHTHYYFRFSALDRPGVLSRIAGVLGDHGISIQSVHQKGRHSNDLVPVVMLSHLACERDVQEALERIAKLDVVGDRPVLIRIEDVNGD